MSRMISSVNHYFVSILFNRLDGKVDSSSDGPATGLVAADSLAQGGGSSKARLEPQGTNRLLAY